MLLTWQTFVLQENVKNLPLMEQKRMFLAHQLQYENMMRQKQMILENANANSNSNASGAGGGGTPMGDLLITFFCIDIYGDGWTGSGSSKGTCSLIHPTRGIVDVGFDNSNGTKPPWQTITNFPTGTDTDGSVPGFTQVSAGNVVYPVTIIEKNIPYPTKQYGIQVITQNNYTSENRLVVSAGWSPYPNRNQLPNSTPVIGVGSTGLNSDVENVLPTNFQASTTYNFSYTIPKFKGGSSGTSDYTGNQAWIRNVVNL